MSDLGPDSVGTSEIATGAVEFSKLGQEVEDGIKQDRTFYETPVGTGARVTLVTQGPLTMFVRCFIDDGGFDRLEIYYTSTEPDWFVTTSGTTVRFADEEVIFASAGGVPTGTSLVSPLSLVGSALAPDGSIIEPTFFNTAGFNIFGHDCLVSGSATAITGNL